MASQADWGLWTGIRSPSSPRLSHLFSSLEQTSPLNIIFPSSHQFTYLCIFWHLNILLHRFSLLYFSFFFPLCLLSSAKPTRRGPASQRPGTPITSDPAGESFHYLAQHILCSVSHSHTTVKNIFSVIAHRAVMGDLKEGSVTSLSPSADLHSSENLHCWPRPTSTQRSRRRGYVCHVL